MTTKLLLLGAGNIGAAITDLLIETGDYHVTVADADADRITNLNAAARTLRLDASVQTELAGPMAEADVVISACPYYLNAAIAACARDHNTHYFDLTEDRETTTAVRAIAEGSPCAFMPQCGLAPGFISIVAHDLASHFDTLRRIKMRVGALPIFPSNRLKYNLTWSTAGLINEYCNPCEVIYDGVLREVLPLEGLEEFSLDGVEYEAFNTSGGLGTLCETLAGKVDNLNYKTIRYPGHCDLMRFLCNDLRLSKRRELFLDVLEHAVPATDQDVVLVFVAVSGERAGKLMQRTYSRKVYHGTVGGHPMAAIQITTAAGVCAAVDLLVAGQLPGHGFIRQEDVPLDRFMSNRFGRLYETHGRSNGVS
ncbi:MAG: saccharopine dehydrogenase NADP-binding domain-containing protein [Myxococcales bacterium]|nr:saccharopine dehydrogenase NADP-binding domain-containing protein [Myxococcales bacterium]MDD9971973.1 saccharopine dehydrogenase NADP-binding domain-containing protein [Myxococcales bacterium]